MTEPTPHTVGGASGLDDAAAACTAATLAQLLEHSARLAALHGQLARWTHDLNTQLGCINGYAELSSDLLPPAGQQYVQQITLACQRASQMVPHLLAGAGDYAVGLQPLLAGEQVAAAVALLQPVLGAALQLDYEVALAPIPVLAEPYALQQLVLQLGLYLRNALPAGGRLAVWLGAPADWEASPAAWSEGLVVLLRVTGSVTPTAQVQLAALQPQADAVQASGAELLQVCMLVRRLQGQIELQGCSPTGTTIGILLPWRAAPQTEEHQHG